MQKGFKEDFALKRFKKEILIFGSGLNCAPFLLTD